MYLLKYVKTNLLTKIMLYLWHQTFSQFIFFQKAHITKHVFWSLLQQTVKHGQAQILINKYIFRYLCSHACEL